MLITELEIEGRASRERKRRAQFGLGSAPEGWVGVRGAEQSRQHPAATPPGGSLSQDNRKGSTNAKPSGLKQILQLGMEMLMFEWMVPHQSWISFVSLKEVGNGQKWGILSRSRPPTFNKCAGSAKRVHSALATAECLLKFTIQYLCVICR